jgi:hypothetical protein
MLLDLGTQNPAFSKYLGRQYPEDRFYGVPQKSLDQKTAEELSFVYSAINGETALDPNAVTVGFTVKNGAFARMYGPSVHSKGGKLVIKWGDELIEMLVNPRGMISWPKQASWVDGAEYEPGVVVSLETNFADAEINGYKSTCIQIEVTKLNGDEVIDTTILNVPIRFVSNDEVLNAVEIKTGFKTKVTDTLALISEPMANTTFINVTELNVGQYEIVSANTYRKKRNPKEFSFAIHLVSGESIWLPNAMVEDAINSGSSQGWLNISAINAETKRVEGSLTLGQSSWPLIMDPPTQHLKTIGVGEYDIVDYYMPSTSNYGTFVIVLKDLGRFYCPHGKNRVLTSLLQSSPEITREKPAKLFVTDCTEKSDGKWTIDAYIILSTDDKGEMLDLI